MSDQQNNTLQQKIRKFSKFITTKVKEKALSKSQNDNDLIQESTIVRRHSSYIHQSKAEQERGDQAAQNMTTTLKQDLHRHYHTLPPITPPISSALSPPPRQMKSKTVRVDNHDNDGNRTNFIAKPCLSRSNTLGYHTPIRNPPPPPPIHHSSLSTTTMSSSSSYIVTSPSSTSLSSLTSRCNVNHTLIN